MGSEDGSSFFGNKLSDVPFSVCAYSTRTSQNGSAKYGVRRLEKTRTKLGNFVPSRNL